MQQGNHRVELLFAGPNNVFSTQNSLLGSNFAIRNIHLQASEMNERRSSNFHVALWHTCATGEHASRPGQYLQFVKPPGSLTFVPPGTIPAARTWNDNSVTWCVIDRDFVDGLASECKVGHSAIVEKAGFTDTRLRSLLELLALEAACDGESGALYVDQLILALSIRLLALPRPSSTRKLAQSALAGRPLREVLHQIEETKGQISLEALAKTSGFSQRHFVRMFQQATGLTPHAYAMKTKIAQVQRLLSDKRLSLLDIALRAGFSSHSHFTKAFKAHHGVTPSLFRRAL